MARRILQDALLAAVLGALCWLAGCAHVAQIDFSVSLTPPSLSLRVSDASSGPTTGADVAAASTTKPAQVTVPALAAPNP